MRGRMSGLPALLAAILLAGMAQAGRVSHWTGDGDAQDAAGANDGVIDGVSFAPGKIGQAFQFDGDTSDEILVADSASLRFPDGTNFTFTVWVRTTAADFSFHDILRKRNRDAGGGLLDMKLSMTSTLAAPPSKPQFYLLNVLSGANAGIVYGTTDLNDGEWHHLAGVYDSASNSMRLYVDGVQEGGTATLPGAFNQTSPLPQWNIGNNPGSPRSPWVGWIDDVTIWDEALSAEEAAALHSLGNITTLNYAADDVARLMALHDAGEGTMTTSDGLTWEYVAGGLTGNGSVQTSSSIISVELGTAGSGVQAHVLDNQGLRLLVR